MVRDQDFRARLLLQDYIEEGADIDKLNKEESTNMHVRPYLSVLGTLLMFMGLAAVLYPLCDVITVIGATLPSANALRAVCTHSDTYIMIVTVIIIITERTAGG